MEATTTKRMPVSYSEDLRSSSGTEFLIPPVSGTETNVFVGLTTGQSFRQGMISFIGRSISPQDIFNKLSPPPADREDVMHILYEFVNQLQNFKVGNVITIQHGKDGAFLLQKIAEHPPRSRSSKLP